MRKLLILALLCPYLTLCQPLSINGKIINEDMEPVPGATVLVKRTGLTLSAGENGELQIYGVQLHDTLMVSAVGYETALAVLRFTENGRVTVVLKRSVGAMAEVIINTGYENIPKERATGSFTVIDNSKLSQQVGASVIERLEGITNSVLFDKHPSRPELTIRGLSTINGPKSPLIILNNFPFEGDINTINPNDVESITILKDAAAASIWGTRAGNGVIVITTKKASLHQPLRFDFSSTLSISKKPDTDYLPYLSSVEYIELEKFLYDKGFYNAQINSSSRPPLTPVVELLISRDAGTVNDADLQTSISQLKQQEILREYKEKIYQPAVTRQFSLSASGGSSLASYNLSAGYDHSVNSLAASSNRWTVRSETFLTPIKNLQVTASVLFTQSSSQNGKPDFTTLNIAGKRIYPYASLKGSEGEALPVYYYRQPYLDTAGAGMLFDWKYYPLEDYKYNRRSSVLNFRLINASVKYTLPVGLSAEVQFQNGYQIFNNRNVEDENSYAARDLVNRFTQINRATNTISYGVPPGGILNDSYDAGKTTNAKGILRYNRSFGQDRLVILAGAEISEIVRTENGYRLYGYNDELGTFSNVDLVNRYPTFINGSTSSIANGSDVSETNNRFNSVYSNASYSIKNRYVATVSARKDASNLFGVKANERGVPLWSAGVAWNLSSEAWYGFGLAPTLKLRGTYGFSGNVDKSRAAITTVRYFGSGAQYTNFTNAAVSQHANPSLKWERVRTVNFGLDFEMAGKWVTGSIDYYTKTGLDLFGLSPIDYTAGLGTNYIVRNVAEMKGSGVDVQLNLKLIDRKWSWSNEINFNYNHSKVTDYFNTTERGSAFLNSGSVVAPVVGQPVYSIISYEWAGLEHTTGNPQGILDGKVSTDYTGIASEKTTVNDLAFSGSAIPTVFGNLNTVFGLGRWSLIGNFTYKVGYYFRRESINYTSLVNLGNGHKDYSARWLKPGDELITSVPSFIYPLNSQRDNFYSASEVLVTPGSHIRLQFVRLSYSAHSRQLGNNIWEAYLNVNNPGLIWAANRFGLDPDYPATIPPSPGFAIGIRAHF